MNKTTPWPNIKKLDALGDKDTIEKVHVPLKEVYSFADMTYLDSAEARPIFETQADIIIKRQSKGIVDVGCRHGPVVSILQEKGYTDFNYMGFDTSPEPIDIGRNLHKNNSSIEYRCCSWEEKDKIQVTFEVDMVVWSGVLIYRPDSHFRLFDDITRKMYKSPYAVIQEPMGNQRIWDDRLALRTIDNDFKEYKKQYKEFNEKILDVDIFAGKRLIVDVAL